MMCTTLKMKNLLAILLVFGFATASFAQKTVLKPDNDDDDPIHIKTWIKQGLSKDGETPDCINPNEAYEINILPNEEHIVTNPLSLDQYIVVRLTDGDTFVEIDSMLSNEWHGIYSNSTWTIPSDPNWFGCEKGQSDYELSLEIFVNDSPAQIHVHDEELIEDQEEDPSPTGQQVQMIDIGFSPHRLLTFTICCRDKPGGLDDDNGFNKDDENVEGRELSKPDNLHDKNYIVYNTLGKIVMESNTPITSNQLSNEVNAGLYILAKRKGNKLIVLNKFFKL